MLTTPVAYIVFNRPEHTATSFARIRQEQPDRLFVIADGPRADHRTDLERCRAVRQIVDQVDWPCEVTRIYADTNLGCRRRVSTGLDRVFAEVDRAIVLEDDCVPGDEFFSFCSQLLDRYRDDPRVATITGDNFRPILGPMQPSYYFSKYVHVWGWACWARSWEAYDDSMSFWPQWRDSAEFAALHPAQDERQYWTRIFDRVHRREIDTWDYAFVAGTWHRGGLTATPQRNLVWNIGFDEHATHTTKLEFTQNVVGHLGTVVHPADIAQVEGIDRQVFETHYQARPPSGLRRVLSGSRRRLRMLTRHR